MALYRLASGTSQFSIRQKQTVIEVSEFDVALMISRENHFKWVSVPASSTPVSLAYLTLQNNLARLDGVKSWPSREANGRLFAGVEVEQVPLERVVQR